MKTIILYISFIMAAFTATAQAPDPDEQLDPKKEEKMKALYVAYITQQLNLTSDEAQKFWPIHAQYDAELVSINKSNLNEIDREEAIVKVKRKYVGSFTKILGNDRCNKFNVHDNAFRERLRNRLKELRQQRRMQNQNQQGGGIRRKNMQR